MDKSLYNRILASMLSLFLIVGCVTYQPQQVDAVLGKIASYTAKKAAVWVAKETATETIEKVLKKKIDVTDPLFEQYVKRIDYDLVSIDGKTFLMRNNLGAAEKTALKDQVGVVVDRMMYGNNAGWLSWLDWWSVGPMLLVGNIIFTEMTDESYSFIDDVLMQAMQDLGFIAPSIKKETDSKTGKPIEHLPPSDTPIATETPSKNYSKQFIVSPGDTSLYNNFSVFTGALSTDTPLRPNTTIVTEVLPNESVSVLGSNTDLSFILNLWDLRRLSGETQSSATSMFYPSTANGSVSSNPSFNYSSYKLYKDGNLIDSGSVPTLKSHVTVSQFSKYNYVVQSIGQDSTGPFMSILYKSTVTSQPTYLERYSGPSIPYNYALNSVVRVYPSTELKKVGYKIKVSYMTDRVITLPVPTPVPKLLGKEVISSPVINNDPKTGKPTMAVPVTAIVQDPVKTPVTADPNGGIIISKPDGTPVTDPETELPPVTNTPEVVTNPTTGEPAIKPTPESPPEPATPTTSEPGTGDPDTGDPDTGTPPTDPDDEDPTKVRWDKLKEIPSFMTTRFPFSLPWDIARFLDAVFPDVTPISELVFEFPDIGSYDTSFEIRIPEYFEPWMDFARAAFIYGFDISLVYAIYRLFGGAE